ncbi:hypothetical protein H072_5666 [Dactylellina haptotyla CBS 200.50]|uniref:protein O-GlcNAc transferase n=1 Tax=Dactylellina haptotyla (strain CBS 200.50) TaxID=1284197 RepID=S8BYP7_DACHA|nr:hypothetical protein H072_5666 [Dactylellina haptotyla CBS 200.50]
MSFGSLLQQPSALHHHPAQLLPAFQPSSNHGVQAPFNSNRPLAPLPSHNISLASSSSTSSSHAQQQADSPRTPVQRAFSDPRRRMSMGAGWNGVGVVASNSAANTPKGNGNPGAQNGAQSILYASPLPSRPTPAETLLRRKTPGGGMVVGGFDAAPPMQFPGGAGVVQLDGAIDITAGRPRKHILLANAGLITTNNNNISNLVQQQQVMGGDMNEPLTPTNSTIPVGQNLMFYGKENMANYNNIGFQQQQQQLFNKPGSLPQITDLSRIPAASVGAQFQSNINLNTPLQHEPVDDSAYPSRSNNTTPVPLDFQRRQSMTPTFATFQQGHAVPLMYNIQQFPQGLQLQNPLISYSQLGALVQDGGPMPAVLGFNSPAPAWSPSGNLGMGAEGPVAYRQFYPYPTQPVAPIPQQNLQNPRPQPVSMHLPQQTGVSNHNITPGNPFQRPLSPKSQDREREMSRDVMLVYCNDAYVELMAMKQQQTNMIGKGRIQPLPRHIGLTAKSVMSGIWRQGARLYNRPELQRHFSDPTVVGSSAIPKGVGPREAYALPIIGNTGSARPFDAGMHGEPESISSASKRRRLNSLQDGRAGALGMGPMGMAPRSGVVGPAELSTQVPPNRRFGPQHRASSMNSLVDMRRRQHPDVRILKANDPPTFQPRYDQQAAFLAQHSPTGSPIALSPNVIPAAIHVANAALEMLEKQCAEENWAWLEGMLLAGCLSYALGDIKKARLRYEQILDIDPSYVEALTNLGSTALSMGNKVEAERFWVRAVKLRPSYFEAVEHLVSLLCSDKRTMEAVNWIVFVEDSIRRPTPKDPLWARDCSVDSMSTDESNGVISMSSPNDDSPGGKDDDYFSRNGHRGSASSNASNGVVKMVTSSTAPTYMIPPAENGRLLQLIHAKGNMLYSIGQNLQAAKAFEDAVLLGTQMRPEEGIEGLIKRILDVLSIAVEEAIGMAGSGIIRNSRDPLLLSPDRALRTARLLFPPHGDLPGLKHVHMGPARKAAINTTSNSLLSLAKIYQDAISAGKEVGKAASSVRDILALYYLSLALHPSPSTANNVGILLASVQQSSPLSVVYPLNNPLPQISGLAPGCGVALALAYYYYGLHLDNRHAHLYTNLGSLLKDMGQLPAAIKMYEQAVECDGRFDIALANLANAVKDQGHVADAIRYYKRAVDVNPDFAEAVCGLANALNSVCDWFARGGVVHVGDSVDRWHVGGDGMLVDSKGKSSGGWMRKVVEIVERQLGEGREWGKGVFGPGLVEVLLGDVQRAEGKIWNEGRRSRFRAILERWKGQSWQGAKLVQLVERIAKKLVWRWYQDLYVDKVTKRPEDYRRPLLPAGLSVPNAPTVLPFHTFTCPLSVSQVRMISQRNGLRISCSTLKSPWLSPLVSPPPRPPAPALHVGYVSSDFNNHPLAHLMQSVFGFHDPKRAKAFCYATSGSDGSQHRQKIEREAPVFRDASTWSIEKLVKQIQEDGIHILINLNGFTRGARNEVFAAKPAPLQMSFMGFAGTLGAEWCDYIYADETAVPRNMLRPWARSASFKAHEAQGGVEEWEGEDYEEGEWVYAENVIYSKNTFFCTDHKQSSPDSKEGQLNWQDEQARRWKMRKSLFPQLGDDKVILGNFNQLYKIEPTTFRTWLRILMRVPNAILWLLRFPDLGEANLLRFARLWAGDEVASRIIFTDVAAKDQHISRARVCDLFLDTPECNAHTTAADVLWSGSPLLTFPRHDYKMCSRIAASIVRSAVPNDAPHYEKDMIERLVVDSEEMYEERAVELASSIMYDSNGFGSGELVEMRKALVLGRWTSALFDTQGWVKSLEKGYWKAWELWVKGERGDIDL